MRIKRAPSAVEILDVIAERWSPRAFDPEKKIERSELEKILEAGRWAPSANNAQPWRCLVGFNFDGTHAKILSALTDSNAVWASKAPVLISLLSYQNWPNKTTRNDWCEQDVGIFLGYLLLQATSLGIHSHPMAGFSKEKIRTLFDLPAEIQPMTCIAFGHYGDPEQLPPEKKISENAVRTRENIGSFLLNGY